MLGYRLPPHITYEQWHSIRDAICLDCDLILKAYQDDSSDEYAPVHVKNALYVKQQLTDDLDTDDKAYKTPWCIWDWLRVFIRNNFYISGDMENKFVFVNAKKLCDEFDLAKFVVSSIAFESSQVRHTNEY